MIEEKPSYIQGVLKYSSSLFEIDEVESLASCEKSLERFWMWKYAINRNTPEVDYADFGAFFAAELSNGDLLGSRQKEERNLIAIELLTHIVLEGNLSNNSFWEVSFEGKLKEIHSILESEKCNPVDILTKLDFSKCD